MDFFCCFCELWEFSTEKRNTKSQRCKIDQINTCNDSSHVFLQTFPHDSQKIPLLFWPLKSPQSMDFWLKKTMIQGLPPKKKALSYHPTLKTHACFEITPSLFASNFLKISMILRSWPLQQKNATLKAFHFPYIHQIWTRNHWLQKQKTSSFTTLFFPF